MTNKTAARDPVNEDSANDSPVASTETPWLLFIVIASALMYWYGATNSVPEDLLDHPEKYNHNYNAIAGLAWVILGITISMFMRPTINAMFDVIDDVEDQETRDAALSVGIHGLIVFGLLYGAYSLVEYNIVNDELQIVGLLLISFILALTVIYRAIYRVGLVSTIIVLIFWLITLSLLSQARQERDKDRKLRDKQLKDK